MANSVDPDEVAHHEPPHLDLHYLQFRLPFLALNSVLTFAKETKFSRYMFMVSFPCGKLKLSCINVTRISMFYGAVFQ